MVDGPLEVERMSLVIRRRPCLLRDGSDLLVAQQGRGTSPVRFTA
jgi:hypothetical protein